MFGKLFDTANYTLAVQHQVLAHNLYTTLECLHSDQRCIGTKLIRNQAVSSMKGVSMLVSCGRNPPM